jgi:dihydrofolate synthase/folylpolyglutamate synthase
VNFAEAEAYLLSLGNEVETMKLGLENIAALLAALWDPQKKYLKVQVAGTNGKGSVCAFLDSMCVQAGIATGVFTSPHLISITERVRINGEDITEADFAKCASRVRETAEQLVHERGLETVPTYFEQVTAIALLAFADAGVELAILETGLGGRFDATTAARAEISVITRIDLDHQEYLGDTIEKIAAEKAAIIRPGSKVVIVDQTAEATNVINEVCLDNGVSPCAAAAIGLKAFGFPPLQLGLAGQHQFENARAATAAAFTLRDHFEISDDDIIAGLKNARHPGRLERIGNFLLDGAHNPSGAAALAAYLKASVAKPVTLVFGAMKDKTVAEILQTLAPFSESIILTRPANSRAIAAPQLLQFVPADFPSERVKVTENVTAALYEARQNDPKGLILVTGSLYLVGEAKKLLKSEQPI